MQVVKRMDANSVKEIDKSLKNKWNWAWLEKKVIDTGTVFRKSKWMNGSVDSILGDFARKVRKRKKY